MIHFFIFLPIRSFCFDLGTVDSSTVYFSFSSISLRVRFNFRIPRNSDNTKSEKINNININ